MNQLATRILSVLLIVSMTQAVRADEKKSLDADFDDFQKREYTDTDGVTLLYRVLPPAKSDQDVKPPLLLFPPLAPFLEETITLFQKDTFVKCISSSVLGSQIHPPQQVLEARVTAKSGVGILLR